MPGACRSGSPVGALLTTFGVFPPDAIDPLRTLGRDGTATDVFPHELGWS
jgi:hypothetical protein